MPRLLLWALSIQQKSPVHGFGIFGSQRNSFFSSQFANKMKFILKIESFMFVQPRMKCETVSYQLLKQLLSNLSPQRRSVLFVCLFVFHQKFMNAIKINSDTKMIDKRLRWNQKNQTAQHTRKSLEKGKENRWKTVKENFTIWQTKL